MNDSTNHRKKGFQLLLEGRIDAALVEFREAIKLNPKDAWAYVGMGRSLMMKKHPVRQLAIACFRDAIQLSPENAPIINCAIGKYYLRQHQPDNAWIFFQKALHLVPDDPEIQFSLSEYYCYKSEFEKARICLKYAELSGKAQRLDMHFNLAYLYFKKNDLCAALTHINQALAIKCDHIQAHRLKALILLSSGNLKEGWGEFEFRESFSNKYVEEKPLWDGSPLNGRVILVHWEHGFGDTILFVRFLKMIKGGTVVFACQPELKLLFQKLPGADTIIGLDQLQNSEIDFDCRVSVISLPYLFGITREDIPSLVPYIFPDKYNVEHWKKRLQGNQYKVGLFWSGNQDYPYNHDRQCPVQYFVDLATIAGVHWFILQYPPVSAEAFADNKNVYPLSKEIRSFADTAAIVQNLDLVITVDTALAHLCGALGKPVWVLLTFFVPSWIWFVPGSHTPWYPTMTLFRQSKNGDWADIFERVRKKLMKDFGI